MPQEVRAGPVCIGGENVPPPLTGINDTADPSSVCTLRRYYGGVAERVRSVGKALQKVNPTAFFIY